MALPEHAAVAEILPGLLAHTGSRAVDDGVSGGGWELRRADGSTFELGATLGSHRVRDGEILHLTPRGIDWPELEYDDLVDAIATVSGRLGRTWGPRHTRRAGLGAGAAAVLLTLVAVLRAGPAWTSPATWALLAAALLLGAGVVLSRAVGDAGAGAAMAALALPFAFIGGGLLLAGDAALTGLSAGHLLAAGAALLLAGVIGYLGVVAWPALFAAATFTGLLAVIGAWLATTDEFEAHEAAAIVAGALLALSPMFTSLAMRMGRVPMPVLPRSTADLVRDDPQPPMELVHAAVARADGLLTGMLLGASLTACVCQVLLIRSDSTAALVLVAVLAVGFLLRARLYPILRQRVPLLVTGMVGLACIAAGPLMADPATLLVMAGPVLFAVAAIAVVAGILYSTRNPNPYAGRFAEYFEILVLVAVVPVVCSVLGLYGYVRGLGG